MWMLASFKFPILFIYYNTASLGGGGAAGARNPYWLASGREEGGWSYLTYRRPIAASDSADAAISMSAPTSVVCAFAPAGSDTLGFHGSNRYTGLKKK